MAKRRLAPLVIVAATLGLGGCSALPQPFAHDGPVTENALIELPSVGAVRVVLAPPLPKDVADPVAAAAVKALTDAGIPASGEPLSNSYMLRGAVAVEDPDSVEGPELVQIEWRLLSPSGQPVGKIDQRIEGQQAGWIARDPAPLAKAARDAASQVAAYFERRGQLATIDGVSEAAVVSPPATLYFEGVTGAPGDGNDSLARALTYILRQAGTPLADSPDRASHRLSGRVEATPKGDGMSEVSIVWRLADRDGRELGKVTQRNPVRAVLIERRWGELAFAISDAAADGVLDAFASVAQPPPPGSSAAPAR
jgi:hypothetical protein